VVVDGVSETEGPSRAATLSASLLFSTHGAHAYRILSTHRENSSVNQRPLEYEGLPVDKWHCGWARQARHAGKDASKVG
jgi:hypothetical protein